MGEQLLVQIADNAKVPPPIPGQVLGLPTPLPLIANPNPIPGSNNRYAYDLLGLLGIYVNCADNTPAWCRRDNRIFAVASLQRLIKLRARVTCAPTFIQR